jgi:tryptophan halogenase
MTNRFVIVGGGTAGWITALLTKKFFPDAPITLIESGSIGILGAGEGTTPIFVDMAKQVDISLSDLIKNTSSTIKQGILFENWNSRGSSFFHGFGIRENSLKATSLNHMTKGFSWSEISLMNYYLAYKDIDLEKTDLSAIASMSNKTLFTKNKDVNDLSHSLENFKSYGDFALHFDARAIAEYLSDVAQKRGVERIDGIVKEVNLDSQGYIESIRLENEKLIDGDFFFDCTGFARLLAVKKLGSKWHSFKESLPAKRAMPFFLDIDKKEIPPYTLAKAMEKGWIWKIPLQHRYGCGYVYDPDRISDDDVKKEIDEFAGTEVEVPRIFNFDPGFVIDPWNKNCLAVGLSNGFVEPLEATSIFQNLNMLNKFFSRKDRIFSKNEGYKKYFNKDIANRHHEIASFIYLHYLTDKTNNDFWKNFALDYKMPQDLETVMGQLQDGVLSSSGTSSLFHANSIFKVAFGNNIISKKNLEEVFQKNIDGTKIEQAIAIEYDKRKAIVDKAIDHSSFLIQMGATFNDK